MPNSRKPFPLNLKTSGFLPSKPQEKVFLGGDFGAVIILTQAFICAA
jgi:hypothetical protein